MRRLRRQKLDERAQRPRRASPLEVPEDMAAVGPERQRARPDDRAHRQGRVEMGKERAAARRLPAQVRAERLRVDRDQRQIVPAGEPFRRRLRRLRGGRKMDVAVGAIDSPRRRRRRPLRPRAIPRSPRSWTPSSTGCRNGDRRVAGFAHLRRPSSSVANVHSILQHPLQKLEFLAQRRVVRRQGLDLANRV